MALSRLSVKIYQLFRILSFLIYLALCIRLVILSLFLDHRYFYLDLNKVLYLTLFGLNLAELLISLFIFKLRNINILKMNRLLITFYDAYMLYSNVTNIKVFKNWYYYVMFLSYCIWQMYDNFNNIFKQRNKKSVINKFLIRLIMIPLFIISQFIVIVINMIHLNKMTLFDFDKYYYYVTIAVLILFIPSLLYTIKITNRKNIV